MEFDFLKSNYTLKHAVGVFSCLVIKLQSLNKVV